MLMELGMLGFIGVLGLGYGAARTRHVFQLRRIVRRDISSDFAETGSIPSYMRNLVKDPLTQKELAAYGSLTMAELLWNWFTIDPSLIHAASFASTEPVHNGWEFANYIHQNFDSLSAAGKEGFLTRLDGYVAEQKVAALLEHSGHLVQVAETANQPIWDFVVDGHLVNIKDVSSIGEIKADALAHPGVEYLVPQHLKDSAIGNIHAVQGFDHDAIQESVKHGVASAHGEGAIHHLGFHLPIVTIGFAAYRNYKLVRDYGQDPMTATYHGAVESIGRGTGVVVGGKVGAAAGFALGGPLGALIGGIGAGVAGALFGGGIAEWVKSRPLHAAIDEMESELTQFGESYSDRIPEIKKWVLAPIRRAEDSKKELSRELAVSKSNWKNRLWPDLHTVSLQETLSVANQKISEDSERTKSFLAKLDEIVRKRNWKLLGLIMANAAELRNRMGYNPSILERIRNLRRKILQERKKLNPKLDLPE